MDDLIRRQDAIDKLEARKDKTAKGYIGNFYNTIIQQDIDALEDLPSEQPERKKGKWKRNITAERDAQLIFTKVYNCSECGYESVGNNLKNFCPNCGADMRGDSDDE